MKNLFIFSLLLCLLACGDPDNPGPSPLIESDDLCIVTGVNFYDPQGAPISKSGNPNTRDNDDLAIYPIPSDGNIFVASINSEVKNIWFVPADKSIDFVAVDYTSLVTDYLIEDISDKQTKELSTVGQSIQLNVSDLNKGYYRVFVENTAGLLSWENIYIDESLSANEIIDFLNTEW